jgi:hypothetical protein
MARTSYRISRVLTIAAVSLLGACTPYPERVDAAGLYVREVHGNVFDTTPVRGAFRPLAYQKAGFTYRCTECHFSIQPPPRQNPLQPEHGNIVLNHGLNTNCLNCHNARNRDVYVDHEGNEIPADQPARLCSKCHGPTYREWEAGIHGRQNGYWDKTKGERTKLFCVQCHDPHNPKFKPMKPLPAPQRTRFSSLDSMHTKGTAP